jgi:hypothetical protein
VAQTMLRPERFALLKVDQLWPVEKGRLEALRGHGWRRQRNRVVAAG